MSPGKPAYRRVEATVPSTITKMKRWIAEIDWLGITRILVIQIIVLFVVLLAVTRYVTWNSDQAQAEFARAFDQVSPGMLSQYDQPRKHRGSI